MPHQSAQLHHMFSDFTWHRQTLYLVCTIWRTHLSEQTCWLLCLLSLGRLKRAAANVQSLQQRRRTKQVGAPTCTVVKVRRNSYFTAYGCQNLAHKAPSDHLSPCHRIGTPVPTWMSKTALAMLMLSGNFEVTAHRHCNERMAGPAAEGRMPTINSSLNPCSAKC